MSQSPRPVNRDDYSLFDLTDACPLAVGPGLKATNGGALVRSVPPSSNNNPFLCFVNLHSKRRQHDIGPISFVITGWPRRHDRFHKAARHAVQAHGPLRAESDYDRLTIDQFTSTPHQPATARLTPVLQLDPGEYWWVQGSKSCQIKGLARKSLKYLSYWNQ